MPSAVIRSPFPFPDIEATTMVKIYQEQDTEDQGPQETIFYEGYAIHDEKVKNVHNGDSKLTTLSGLLIIKGDVQSLEIKKTFQGYVKIGESRKQIYAIRKPKLLGVVYTTEIDLQ